MPAAADCVSPWKTFFSCDIANSDAHAEFCKLDDPGAYPAWIKPEAMNLSG
jgi:hypothetical protein